MATDPTPEADAQREAPGGGAVPGELDPALVAAIERLALELADRSRFADQAAQLDWLIGILIARGHLTQNHRPLIDRVRARHRLPIMLGVPSELPDPDIDCASLLPLCHGRCCSFTVALTAQEVRAGAVPWDLDEPYKLAKDPTTGYCANLDCAGRCRTYATRPGICRTYDCREDPRVWIDFSRRIPAPMPADVIPLGHTDEP
jgi:hypothetical protein